MAQGPFGNTTFGNTVLPTPGGVGSAGPAFVNPPEPAFTPPRSEFKPLYEVSRASLLELAAPLLSLAFRLKNSLSYANIDELKKRLAAEIKLFQSKSGSLGLTAEQINVASFGLCCYLDETIQNTPWGHQHHWWRENLLIQFHGVADGGEMFFRNIEYLVKQPSEQLRLIQLYYVLLSLGFKGKYGLSADSAGQLDKIRTELYHLNQSFATDPANELSIDWMGQKAGGNRFVAQVPAWVFASVALGLLLFIYLGFYYAINGYSTPVYRDLLMLSGERLLEPTSNNSSAAPAQPAAAEPKSLERFKVLLRDEIAANMVEVVDDNIIRVRNSFLSGSDQIKPEFMPMLKKIAKELENHQDSIVVTGHTDDKPIISARFPSNWQLSVARANNVLNILRDSGRFGAARAEGLGDGQPLAPNDSAEHRALNRRVDIFVK